MLVSACFTSTHTATYPNREGVELTNTNDELVSHLLTERRHNLLGK